nr:monofunctional biosynthetic peptidoglycan transglycosylase [uncultured Desulfobulbus sp.]
MALFRLHSNSPPAPSSKRGGRGWLIRLLRRLCFFVLLFTLTPILAILAFRWLPVPVSSFMVLRQLERVKAEGTIPPLRYHWVSLEAMDPAMPMAVIAGEDQLFAKHWGFDFAAIKHALTYNKTHNHRMLGASTLSQQTAKNLFLWGGRNLVRKAAEAGLTLCIEFFWPKKRILEVYLNIAEFGDNIYGVGAASKYLFKTTPKRLSRRQAALLAAVLPNPRRFHANHPSSYTLSRARWIEKNIGRLGGSKYLESL